MVASAERLKKVMPDGKLKVRWDEMDDCYIVSIPSGKHSFYPVLEGHQGGDGREGKEVSAMPVV